MTRMPGAAVAVKIQKSAARYSDAARDEIKLLRAIRQQDLDGRAPVAMLLDSFMHSGPNGRHVCLVFEVMGRSLLNLIKRFRYRGAPLSLVRKLAHNLLRGLHFLHNRVEIIHTDLKPENVLFVPSAENYAVIHREAALFCARLVEERSRRKPLSSVRSRTVQASKNQRISAERKAKPYAADITRESTKPLTKNQRKRLKAKERRAKTRVGLDSDQQAMSSEDTSLQELDKNTTTPPSVLDKPVSSLSETNCEAEADRDVMLEVGSSSNETHARGLRGMQVAGSGNLSTDFRTESHTDETTRISRSTTQSESFDDKQVLSLTDDDSIKMEDGLVNCGSTVATSKRLRQNSSNVSLDGVKSVEDEGYVSADTLPCFEEKRAGTGFDENFKICDILDHDDLYRSAQVSIIDLGNACWSDSQSGGIIQTRQYRSPEVIMGSKFSQSADIWSLACIVFELATGEFLFDPHSGRDYDRDEDHLGQMIELLGPMPRSMLTRGVYAQELFNRRGELRHIRELKFWPLQDVLVQKYGMELETAEKFSDFLLLMLQFEPSQRATAAECLQHPFLRNL